MWLCLPIGCGCLWSEPPGSSSTLLFLFGSRVLVCWLPFFLPPTTHIYLELGSWMQLDVPDFFGSTQSIIIRTQCPQPPFLPQVWWGIDFGRIAVIELLHSLFDLVLISLDNEPSVLLSSVFLIADSVVRGDLMMAQWFLLGHSSQGSPAALEGEWLRAVLWLWTPLSVGLGRSRSSLLAFSLFVILK